MKPRLSQKAPLLLALALWCGTAVPHASPWLELDKMAIKEWRLDLTRLEDDMKRGKIPAEMSEAASDRRNRLTSQIRELDERIPARRYWAEVGTADARRDVAKGKIHIFTIDPMLFTGTICEQYPYPEVSKRDWDRAFTELTGATLLPVRSHGSDLHLLRERVVAYNSVVHQFLRARHGEDISEQVRTEVKRGNETRVLWLWTRENARQWDSFIAALFALILVGRLIRIRKGRERQAELSA